MNIKTVALTVSLGAGALLIAGCSAESRPAAQAAQPVMTSTSPPSGPPVSINAEMVSVVDHAGHALWDVEREGRAPKTPAEWELVAEHATQMAAAGTLITLPGTGPNDSTLTKQADWKKWARAMSDAGLAALRASESKDMGRWSQPTRSSWMHARVVISSTNRRSQARALHTNTCTSSRTEAL